MSSTEWESFQRYANQDLITGSQKIRSDSESGVLPSHYQQLGDVLSQTTQKHPEQTLNQMPQRARQSFYELLAYMTDQSQEGEQGRTIQQFISDTVQSLASAKSTTR